jgi:predicted RNase H-like HicB family nuclease
MKSFVPRHLEIKASTLSTFASSWGHLSRLKSNPGSTMLEYQAAYFKEKSGWYVVEVMDYPGVSSQGKTLRSARMMIRDALKLMAECQVENGAQLPRPNAKAKPTLGRKPDFVETIPLRTRFHTAAVK